MTAVKVSGCGTAVRLDFGSGFETIGLVDSVTPFNRNKTINDTPTLDCDADNAEVGTTEQSTMTFSYYWDPQDTIHTSLEDNFDDSVDDASIRTIPAQLVVPSYTTGGAGAAAVVTYEADIQIAAIEPEEITPDGYYKASVTLLRKGDITKTSV